MTPNTKKNFGQPALGYVSRLYVRGDALLGDLTGVPKVLAEAIRAGKYERVSVDIYVPYLHESTGRKFPLVLKSVSFKGALPGITDLDAVAALYYQQNESQNLKGGEKIMQTFTNPNEELDAKAHAYADKRGISYADAVRHVAADEPELWAHYNSGGGGSLRERGDAVDREVKRYQAEHPGVSYGDALRTLMAQEEQAEAKAVKETEFRTRAYMSEFQLDRDEARRRVLAHDKNLDPYIESKAPRLSRLGSLLSGARREGADGGGVDVPLALSIARNMPDLVQAAAGERLDGMVYTEIRIQGLPGHVQTHYAEFLRQLLQRHPDLALAYENGTLTEQGQKELIPAWFSAD